MKRTVFVVPKMDCAAEEQLVRMALDGSPIERLDFDLGNRRLTVLHSMDPERLLALLVPLELGARIARTSDAEVIDSSKPATAQAASQERTTLHLLLSINAVMFLVEFVAGWLFQSTGLIADSLDMFGDAAVYGVSLYAVGRAAAAQAGAARLSGYLQLLLAVGTLAEVLRRLVMGSEPEGTAMIGVALVALLANVTCMALISRHRQGGVHMRASWIFSTNDVIANIGVIAAGALVTWTGSQVPDLLVGTAVALIVFSGAVRILRMSRRPA